MSAQARAGLLHSVHMCCTLLLVLLPPLVIRLTLPSWSVVLLSCSHRFYGDLATHGVVAALIPLCCDPDRAVRKFACFAIGNAGAAVWNVQCDWSRRSG